MKKYGYFNNCVNWDAEDVCTLDGLSNMIENSIEITRKTFLKHTDREQTKDIELQLGYSAHFRQGLVMARDWAVSYYRSKLHGRRVYFFDHSAIEYVFT